MGRQLMIDYPSFLTNIQSMDKILQTLKDDAPSWSIEGEARDNPQSSF
jgi:hypothetical protein